MKKIIRILFVCLFFIALIFIGKNVLKDGKEREYIKSDKYYEENIENININEVNFKFLQVNEVANVNEAFYNKYDSYKEVVVEDNKNYDVFEKYTKVDVAFDQGYSGMRCYLNEDESFGGAYFRYTFEYETNDENLVDSSIEVYITAEPLEKFEGLLPTIEEADEGNVYSIYDNILYYMENDDLINSINKLSNELNDQENLRKQLTGDIAHELRTPLTSIKGHLDAIIVGIWEPTNERLNSINEEVKRITNLVDELRKLAKFDSGKDNLNKEIVNLKNYIKSIAYNYEGKALEKNIVIKYQLENIEALIDKEKFAQVIINILSNAIKYNNGNNAIYIKVFKKNNSINISIKDSGIGIPKSEYKNIFERFYRLDKSRGANEKGAGVGLTIAKSIVNAHGGEIEVYSEINKGSEFIISLPS